MKAASRLADCLLKDLCRLDMPLSSEYADRAHFAGTYLWYYCGVHGSPTSTDGIGPDLSPKDSAVLFDSCCQYLQLLLLGQKEATTVPKQLAIILKSFRKPLTAARWKVVIAGLQKVLRSIITCIEASVHANTLSLACCLAETVAAIVPFLIKFQNFEAAAATVQDFLSSVESGILSDFIGRSNLGGLKLLGSMLETFVQSTACTKLTKEQSAFSQQIVEKSLSSLNGSLQEFKPSFAKLEPVIARAVITSIESLTSLLMENKVGEVLSPGGLETAVGLYACQLQLCEAALSQLKQIRNNNDVVCQILRLKRDVFFRKLRIVNVHVQKDKTLVTGRYKFASLF